MGYNYDSANNNNRGNAGNAQPFEKATDYINISLPTADGGLVQIGKIPLRQGEAYEKMLIDLLAEDSEKGLARIVAAFRFDHRKVIPASQRKLAI